VDHVWAAFCVPGDSIIWLGVSDLNAAHFAAAHAGTKLDLEASLIDADTTEGVIEPTYGLVGASLGGYTSKAWWSDVVRALGYERAHKVFGALEDSLKSYLDFDAPPDCEQYRQQGSRR
jgi:hypothetical protein